MVQPSTESSKDNLSKRDADEEDINEVIVDLDPNDENSNKVKRQLLLRRFWQSAFGFWSRTRGERRSWFLTGLMLVLIFLNLAASYGMNIWNREIFDALEKRDSSRVLFIALIYFPLLAASVCVMIAQVYGKMTMQRRWRAWLTHHLLDRWLRNGRYYQLHLVTGDHRNPEYRIADDVRLATEAPVDFSVGLTNDVLSALMFIAVLWTIGGSLAVDLAGRRLQTTGLRAVTSCVY